MKIFWKCIRRVAVALTVLALAACEAGDGPTTVVDQLTPQGSVRGVQLVRVREGLSLDPVGTLIKPVNALVGATLTTADVRLVISPFSMSYNATVTIESLKDGTLGFRFGPSGLRFNPSAKLRISAAKANLTGIDPRRLKIAGASDSRGDWQIIQESAYNPLTNSVTGPVQHFSRYALCVGN